MLFSPVLQREKSFEILLGRLLMKYFKYETECILLLFMSIFMRHFLILETTACGC